MELKKNSYFLETTALYELCFLDAKTEEEICKLIIEADEIQTSQYVIFELARGAVRNLILLQRKACQVDGFSGLEEYVAKSFPAPHRAGTCMGAFAAFHKDFSTQCRFDDKQHLKFFKAHLQMTIRRGWKKAIDKAAPVLNEIGCAEITPPFEDETNGHYDQKLPKKSCGIVGNCGLKEHVTKYSEDFKKIRGALQALEKPDNETSKRIKSLRELYRNPKRNFKSGDCYYCGDALIAHEARNATCIVTKNGKHFSPICDEIKSKLVVYH